MLAARCDSSDDNEALAALKATKSLVKEVPEIMHRMGGVAFVQSVELTMVVPLLLRGLRERSKRQQSVSPP